MRIACPNCAATYDVPDQMLASGRKVRCGKCGTQWLPAAAPAQAEAVPPGPPPAGDPEPPLPKPEPPPRPMVRERLADLPRAPANPAPLAMDRIADSSYAVPESAVGPIGARRRRTAAWLGWAVSIVIWGLVVWAAYHYRADIMAAWPPSQRLYAALGLGPGS
jgi:predicted Zn finger-like uncharacterized protein